ncbi:MAG: dihydropteroate synthase [Atopobiaceae bacterium]|nr:dihydropteroate synthase [Atopobiaceae bacterium]
MLRENYSTWHCGKHELSLVRPRIMGVLNVTPDSFSDGGRYKTVDDAVAHALDMLDAGADIIDVGGESTRPGFTPVSPEEEAARVVPVVRALVAEGACVSIDTRHPEVARMCVRLGASIINDVTGFTDPAMVEVAAGCDAGCIVMHAGEVAEHPHRITVTLDSSAEARERAATAARDKGRDDGSDTAAEKDAASAETDAAAEKDAGADDAQPELPVAGDALALTMGRSSARGVAAPTVRLAGSRRFTLPESAPIMRQVMGFLGDQARTLMRAGVSRERICVDPGPGFGKMADEDVVIQRATAKMASMGYPVLCAVSRQRFVGAVSGTAHATDRDPATAGVCLAAVSAGARILRVHDVAGCAQALDGYWSIAHPDVRRAFVSLGSNVGDRIHYLERACELINAIPLTCVVQVSHAYETEPAYGIATPVANCVAEIQTELSPLVLLGALLGVEDRLDRRRVPGQEGYGPRTIDCDLAWMEGESHAGRRLRLPHPGLGERDYVLVPMEDLMHDPVRFLQHAGVDVLAPEDRVGHVLSDLGEVAWQH